MPDEVFEETRKHFSDEELANLTIGGEVSINAVESFGDRVPCGPRRVSAGY